MCKKILIIDDEKLICSLLTVFFQKEVPECEVFQAKNGDQLEKHNDLLNTILGKPFQVDELSSIVKQFLV